MIVETCIEIEIDHLAGGGSEKRLANVVEFLRRHSFEETLRDIRRLQDHKGLLMVTWRHEPSRLMRAAIEMAWEAQIECCIEHVVEGTDQKFCDGSTVDKRYAP